MTDRGSLNNDQAEAIARQLILDIENALDVDEACNVYSMLAASRVDQIAVGRHLVVPFTEAIEAFLHGDRSPRVLRIVAVARLADGAE